MAFLAAHNLTPMVTILFIPSSELKNIYSVGFTHAMPCYCLSNF